MFGNYVEYGIYIFYVMTFDPRLTKYISTDLTQTRFIFQTSIMVKCLQILPQCGVFIIIFILSKVTAYKYWVSGITCHMYSREERTILTGEINDMSAFIPGA